MCDVIEIRCEYINRYETPSQNLAAKNLIHGNLLNESQNDNVLRRLYYNLCTLPNPTPLGEKLDAQKKEEVIRMEAIRRYKPREKETPSFIRDLHLTANGNLVCLSQIDKQLMFMDFQKGLAPTRAPRDILSATWHENKYLVLDAKGRYLYTLSDTFLPQSTYNIETLGLTPQAIYLDRTEIGFSLTDRSAKRIVFVDDMLRVTADLKLNHLAIMKRGVGFREGVLLLEVFPGRRDCGELLWVSPSGELFTLLDNLRQPTSAKCCGEKILVCDLVGLHVLTFDDLAIIDRKFIPWDPMLQTLGIQQGYGFEVLQDGSSLFVVFMQYIPGVTKSLSYTIVEFLEIVSSRAEGQ